VSVREGIKAYYSLFGLYGLLQVAKARLLQRPVEVVVSVSGIKHPLHLRFRTTDVSLLSDILLHGEYDWEFPKSPRVIVDAGANIGLACIFFANRYPEAKIVAIEPEESNYEMLRKNTACYPNVVPILGALWKDNKDLCLLDNGAGEWGFRTEEQSEPCNRKEGKYVFGVTLDKLMADHNLSQIDILKIDIEGAEREVFESSSRWINKVGAIVVELHDQQKAGCSRAVYSATCDFDVKLRRGETTFLAKASCLSIETGPGNAELESADIMSRSLRPKICLKILRAD